PIERQALEKRMIRTVAGKRRSSHVNERLPPAVSFFPFRNGKGLVGQVRSTFEEIDSHLVFPDCRPLVRPAQIAKNLAKREIHVFAVGKNEADPAVVDPGISKIRLLTFAR